MARWALTNATLFTATDESVIERGTVVVNSNRIEEVLRTPPPAGSDLELVDGEGLTVLPGLIDAHAHLVYNRLESASFELFKSVEEAMLDSILNADLLLRTGITAIRDPGTRGNIAVLARDAIADGRIPGPRVRAAKQIITVRGGLVDWHPSHLFADGQPANLLSRFISGPWEARDAVREQAKDGVDWIKVEASGTGANPLCPAHRNTMSVEELRAVIDEATDKGIPVACHAESAASIVRGAEAGARTIEHAVYLDDDGLEAIAKHGVAVCPTLANYAAFANKGLEAGVPASWVEQHQKTHKRHVESIRKLYDAGVPIVFGSDCGAVSFPHGENLEEVCAYVELVGMSEEDALLTATRNAAEVVGFSDLGTLRAGNLADMVVFSENPLQRIRALREPDKLRAVIQGGRVVSGQLPAGLSA